MHGTNRRDCRGHVLNSEGTGTALVDAQLEQPLVATNRFEGLLANLLELPLYPGRKPRDEHRRLLGQLTIEQGSRNPASKNYPLNTALMFKLKRQDNGIGGHFDAANQIEQVDPASGSNRTCQETPR